MAAIKKTSTGYNVVNSRTGEVLKQFSGEGARSKAVELEKSMEANAARQRAAKDGMSVINHALATQHDK